MYSRIILSWLWHEKVVLVGVYQQNDAVFCSTLASPLNAFISDRSRGSTRPCDRRQGAPGGKSDYEGTVVGMRATWPWTRDFQCSYEANESKEYLSLQQRTRRTNPTVSPGSNTTRKSKVQVQLQRGSCLRARSLRKKNATPHRCNYVQWDGIVALQSLHLGRTAEQYRRVVLQCRTHVYVEDRARDEGRQRERRRDAQDW